MNKLLIILFIGISGCKSQNVSDCGDKPYTNETGIIEPYKTVPAEFNGGQGKLNLFIKENLKIPQSILTEKIKGIVYVQIEIDETGKIIKSKVLKGIVGCEECSTNSLQLVNSMPRWSPSYKIIENNNIYIISTVIIEVPFD